MEDVRILGFVYAVCFYESVILFTAGWDLLQ